MDRTLSNTKDTLSYTSQQTTQDRTQNPSTSSPTWTVEICPTTGGQFTLQISPEESVDGLKKVIARKLKLSKERISLLHKERLLKEGSLRDNLLYDSCQLRLLPNVESGLLSQKPEQSVMQALETLSESQISVNDFLCGKSPLTLAMRLGDHMMFVQLQLSTSPPTSKRTPSSSSSSSSSSSHSSSQSSSSKRQASSSHSSRSTGHKSARPRTPVSSPPSSPTSIFPSPPPSPLTPSPPSSPISPAPPRQARVAGDKASKAVYMDNVPLLDSAALAEAGRNLSQKLKELSQASTSHMREETTTEQTSGAIIESMHHHGQGVYSGTFSGTLNPALQDKDGKPKRSIGTIVHILNDLLGATPQYRAQIQHKKSVGTDTSDRHAHRSPRSPGERSRLSQENRMMRGKVEHIQMMLEERRQRRRARRAARSSPYPRSWNHRDNAHIHQQQEQQPMEVDSNLETSNMADNCTDASAYTELKHETVVA